MTAEMAEDRPQSINEFIRSRRLELGLTMAAMGERLALGEVTYRNWERGQRPKIQRVDDIARALEVSRYRVLAAFGILTLNEADVLDREFAGVDIPGYRDPTPHGVVIPLVRSA